jgi:thiamine-monophosphate kinase
MVNVQGRPAMTSVEELGERRIIELFLERFRRTPDMAVPFGDDVAAIALAEETVAVLKTDVLVGMTDVPPTMTLRQAARKAVVMNISDFAAKGVPPRALLVALTIPRDYTRTEIEAIGDGLNAGAEEYETYIIGGDTSEGMDLTICCMVFGVAKRDTMILRSGARRGDVVAVTGLFGKTSAGLKILMDGHVAPPGLREKLVDSVYRPRARLREGLALARTGVVTAAIDSSDGLAICLHELRRNSGIGLEVTTVPIAPEAREFAERHGFDPEALALYGGEEYELVVTVKPEGWQCAVKAVAEAGGTLIAIGRVVEGNEVTQRKGTVVKPIPLRGWEHFKQHAV